MPGHSTCRSGPSAAIEPDAAHGGRCFRRPGLLKDKLACVDSKLAADAGSLSHVATEATLSSE
eukprot:2773277-Alexandrium_andersonii.AAC.1